MATIFVDTDHVLRLIGLVDQDEDLVESASVVAQLLDSAFAPISAPLWPLTLGPDRGGNYSAAIPDDADVTIGVKYRLRIDVDNAGVKSAWFVPVIVERRTA